MRCKVGKTKVVSTISAWRINVIFVWSCQTVFMAMCHFNTHQLNIMFRTEKPAINIRKKTFIFLDINKSIHPQSQNKTIFTCIGSRPRKTWNDFLTPPPIPNSRVFISKFKLFNFWLLCYKRFVSHDIINKQFA